MTGQTEGQIECKARDAMLVKVVVRTAMLVACVAMNGCATSRSEIKLSSPVAAPSAAAVSTGRTVVIRSIKDERQFEQAPSDPSTPSLGFEGADKASAETKARAIGRKRGGFGKALGDVLLQDGETVTSVIRSNLTAALQEAGYQVKSEEAAGPSPLIIDVHIKKFWAWFEPGFWAIKLHTNITTDLDLSSTTTPTIISVHAEQSGLAATEGAWMEIVDKALTSYRAEVVSKARTFP
jgi:hypothetical protein